MTGNGEGFNEQLSALCDDELGRDEYALALRRLGRDGEARARLARYHLIRDSLHGNLPPRGAGTLAARVAAALEQEPPLQASRRLGAGWLKPVAGAAVAATVALAALLLVPSGGPPQPGGSALQAGSPQHARLAGAELPAASLQVRSDRNRGTQLVSSSAQGWDRLEPAARQRLRGLLVNHSEQSSTGRLGGVLNYVRIAGHERSE